MLIAGGQYLKVNKAEKKNLVMQARFEALAKEGGQKAIRKAIEKKGKKMSQKERRSRPYSKEQNGKRDGEALVGGRSSKRTRV